MDIIRLIANDHANITHLCQAIPRAVGGGAGIMRTRDRLFGDLVTELDRHLEAKEESLYEALEEHPRTRAVVDQLEDQADEIRDGLARLAKAGTKNSRAWTDAFEDFSYLIDQHFHTESHELIPAAVEVLGPSQIRDLVHDFIEEKVEALRRSLRRGRIRSTATIVGGALAGAAVLALAATVWRAGSLRAFTASLPERQSLPGYGRIARGLGYGESAPPHRSS